MKRPPQPRTVAAPPDDVWAHVGDPVPPAALVAAGRARRGRAAATASRSCCAPRRARAIRADFRVVRSQKPEVRRWRQEVAGTPFEGILESAETEIRLEPAGEAGTRVTLEQDQRLRGLARFGGFMAPARRRDARSTSALDGLEMLHGA